jgi:hypothetical protein
MLELQADLDAQNIAQLREQNKELADALAAERACGEKHAEALMRIARSCDDRVDELKAQHAAAIVANQTVVAKLEDAAASLQAQNATLAAANAAAMTKLEKEKTALEVQVAVLQAQATTQLTDIHNGVAALQTLFREERRSGRDGNGDRRRDERDSGRGGRGGRGGEREITDVRCFACHERGHMTVNCPMRPGARPPTER